MVGSSILCGLKSSVTSIQLHHPLGLKRSSRDGVVGCSGSGSYEPKQGSPQPQIPTVIGGLGLGNIREATGQELRQRVRVSRYGIVGCANELKGGVVGGLGRSVASIGQERRRAMIAAGQSSLLGRVTVRNQLKNEREDVSSSPKEEKKSVDSFSSDNKEGLVEKIKAELGRQFGSALWFSVLLICLAIFGGGYAFFIFTYADFTDIPILRGPQR